MDSEPELLDPYPRVMVNSSGGGQGGPLMRWTALGPGEAGEQEPKSALGIPEPREKQARALTRHGVGVKGWRVANDHSNAKGQKCKGQTLEVIIM